MRSITEAQEKQLRKARTELLERDATFVLVNGDLILDSQKRGVAPILDILSGDASIYLKHAVIADKVIGRAAALLLVLGGVDALDTHLISDHAIDIFEKYDIPYTYDKNVPYIVNREGTDMCPMEKAVLGIDDPAAAKEAILSRIAELRRSQETGRP